MTILDALKPCPFCGGDARLKTRESDKLPAEYHVACFSDCEVSPSVWRGSEAEAIAVWNRRAALSQPQAGEPEIAETPWGEIVRVASPQPANPAQVTDAMVDELLALRDQIMRGKRCVTDSGPAVKPVIELSKLHILDDAASELERLSPNSGGQTATVTPAARFSTQTGGAVSANPSTAAIGAGGQAVTECTKFNAVGRKCVGGECDWHRAYIVMESTLRESQDRCRKLQAKLDTHPAPSGQAVADARYPSVFYSKDRTSRVLVAQYQGRDYITVGIHHDEVPHVWYEVELPPEEALQFALHILSKPHVSTLSQPHPADERVVEAAREIAARAYIAVGNPAVAKLMRAGSADHMPGFIAALEALRNPLTGGRP